MVFLHGKSCFFLQKKASPYLRIFGYYFSLQITTILSALNFPNFKLKLLITFEIIAVDNFKHHIWSHHILLVNIQKNEDNRRGKKISTNPPTNPPTPSNKTFSRFQKGGLPMRILKPPVPLPTPIKCKVKTIGPLSGSAPQSPSGG